MKYVVTVNGERYEVEVERVDGKSSSLSRKQMERGVKTRVETEPAVSAAPVSAPAAAAPAASNAGGGSAVISPMPGVILDIKVKEGDSISEGQVVVILEAMKMENEIVNILVIAEIILLSVNIVISVRSIKYIIIDNK